MPTRTAEEWILYSALSSPVCVPEALSVYLQSHGANNNLLAQSWGESIILYLVLPACCSGSSYLVSILRPHSTERSRGRPTGPDGSHLVLMPPPSLGGGGSGGGSRGGPVGSFARTSLSHSSLQRHAPRRVMRLSPKACSWSIPYSRAQLEFRKQTISACRSLPVIAGKFSNTIYQPRRVFTFAGHRSKYIRERFRFRFRHPRSKSSVSSPTDKTNR